MQNVRAGLTRMYRELGLPVIVVKAGEKAPKGAGWQLGHMLMSADSVEKTWRKGPDLNIGCLCGQTGIVVVDLDGPEACAWGLEHLHTSVFARTGSGGLHAYFRWPVGVPIKKRAVRIPGLVRDAKTHTSADLYGDGSQVVMPGSVVDGKPYWWVLDGTEWRVDLFDSPEELVRFSVVLKVALNVMPVLNLDCLP